MTSRAAMPCAVGESRETGVSREPRRIQRKRTKGWRMPEGTVYVGRPTRWGNPFRVGEKILNKTPLWITHEFIVGDADHAVRLYRAYIGSSANRVAGMIPELGGKDLACWCPLDQPCHADVLLKLANQ